MDPSTASEFGFVTLYDPSVFDIDGDLVDQPDFE
jgi:hypothetical protein